MRVSTPAASDTGIAAKSASVRQAFQRFWPYVRVDRRFLVFAMLLLVLSAAAETAAIWTFGSIINDALGRPVSADSGGPPACGSHWPRSAASRRSAPAG